ncbi:F-box/LRR-repeat protein At3g26922-like [Hordeum vulgare subsp. vulgare]|uniref:F-box/LRR-repeat protein At3g26922-like n=1 Tax=Hordeum vulgare subsp. vulgare TaxID=112509 RepID=UPI001D1A5830|nr:F-box/LRR-repeat protein At3g26922-like [Hordeum vulgare subsp. vulgare]
MADSKKVAMAGGKDRFEDLPDHVLELLLSFLDALNAVRTSVLARRWRNLWKSVPVLRFDPYSNFSSAENFNNFVNKVLECRDQTSPLRECHINSYMYGEQKEIYRDVESWVQYAVSCQVSVLRVLIQDGYHLYLSNNSVISRHLTDLMLYSVDFDESPLDLVSCDALEVLDIDCCSINLGDILPKSLRHLTVKCSIIISMHTQRSRLSAPGLVTFELEDCEGWTPLLDNVPSLVTSSIIIEDVECNDSCDAYKYLGDCGVESCEGCYVEDDCSVILEGLSGATNLKLISVYSMEFGIDSSESYNPSEYFLVSKHLMIVEIHCRKKDKMIFQIEKILGTHGVTPAQLDIKLL